MSKKIDPLFYVYDTEEGEVLSIGKTEAAAIAEFKAEFDIKDYADGGLIVLEKVGNIKIQLDMVVVK